MARNGWLIAGGLSALAALLHLAVIVGGPDWYRFFGAGEAMARAAERGSLYPPLVTLGIATVLGVWAAYAFAGAGLLRRLPLMRTALVAITAVYLLRGLALLPALMSRAHRQLCPVELSHRTGLRAHPRGRDLEGVAGAGTAGPGRSALGS